MDYKIEDLTNEEAAYIGEKINEIVPHEVDSEEEKFVIKIENENGDIIGGCIAEAYEYHWSRMFLRALWVDERYRHQGIGSAIIREVERIARQKGCAVFSSDCEPDNFGSLKFHLAMGFEEANRIICFRKAL